MRRRPVALATAALVATLVATECESTREAAPPGVTLTPQTVQQPAAPPAKGASEVRPDARQATAPQISPLPSDPAISAIPRAGDLALLGASMMVPVAGVARSQLRDSYTEARGERAHEALDILAPRGTPVVSASDGRLLKVFDSRAGGLMVYATDPSERFILLYGHLDRYAEGLRDGMPLVRGQRLGYVGSTGNAAPGTPHLHFGVLRGDPAVSWSAGVAVNPYGLLTHQP